MECLKCPRCDYGDSYLIRRQKRRCKQCRYEWRPSQYPLHLDELGWKRLVTSFLEDGSSNIVARKTGLDRKRVLRILAVVRQVLISDIPKDFSWSIRGNEKEAEQLRLLSGYCKIINGRNSFCEMHISQIRYDHGEIWVEIETSFATEYVFSEGYSREDRLLAYMRAWERYVRRVERGNIDWLFSSDRNIYDEDLMSFFRYLRSSLAKGGIRTERLHLYIGEIVWRYNNRSLSIEEQAEKILSLLRSG